MKTAIDWKIDIGNSELGIHLGVDGNGKIFIKNICGGIRLAGEIMKRLKENIDLNELYGSAGVSHENSNR